MKFATIYKYIYLNYIMQAGRMIYNCDTLDKCIVQYFFFCLGYIQIMFKTINMTYTYYLSLFKIIWPVDKNN